MVGLSSEGLGQPVGLMGSSMGSTGLAASRRRRPGAHLTAIW